MLGNNYLITGASINEDKINEITGRGGASIGAGEGISIAEAKTYNDDLPDTLKYLIGKELEVYDGQGNKVTATINEFIAANITIPYWGYVVQWQQQDLSDVEVAKKLIEMGELVVVARLDLEEGFDGIVAHLKSNHSFSWGSDYYDDDIIDNAWRRMDEHVLVRESDSLLAKSIKEENAYSYIDEPVSREAKSLKLGDATFVYMNIIYGDYCDYQKDGHFYRNIMAVWNDKSDAVDILDHLLESAHFEFTPVAVDNGSNQIPGFIKKYFSGMTTWFRYPEWKCYSHLGIWAHECD